MTAGWSKSRGPAAPQNASGRHRAVGPDGRLSAILVRNRQGLPPPQGGREEVVMRAGAAPRVANALPTEGVGRLGEASEQGR